jgi:hypothetical protein
LSRLRALLPARVSSGKKGSLWPTFSATASAVPTIPMYDPRVRQVILCISDVRGRPTSYLEGTRMGLRLFGTEEGPDASAYENAA